tara:strand:+ start:948 stop:1058 length:111 start_codon:yes stop_codon:yes gene_type:complete
MASDWVKFVQAFAKEKGISYKVALKEAGASWRAKKK